MIEQPKTSLCPRCKTSFPYRSNKKFCSAECRKLSHQDATRKAIPYNATNSRHEARVQEELFELHDILSQQLYELPPFERLGFLESKIMMARNGRHPKIKKILTTPRFIVPTSEQRRRFHLKHPHTYKGFGAAANSYSLFSPWNSSVDKVVLGVVP